MKYNDPSKNAKKTLSSRAAAIFAHFNSINKPAFTFKEVAAFLPASNNEAVKKLMRDMVKRGLLLRLKDGVYWIIPYEQDPSNYLPNPHLIARYLIGDADYYIGYYSALEFHSLITQPSFREQIVVNRQLKPAELLVKRFKFQFIFHNSGHFFGEADFWVDSFSRVKCSDLEKTLVDCLFKPDYGGGITEIAKALYKAREKVDYLKLFNYCERFKTQSVIKRLGFLLELLKIDDPIISKLQSLRTPTYALLDPAYGRKGTLDRRWYIQQNMDVADITSPIYF